MSCSETARLCRLENYRFSGSPVAVLITPLFAIFLRLGVVNGSLGLIISYVAITVPVSVYLLLGSLDTIPRGRDVILPVA